MKRMLNFFVFLIAILALNNISMAQTGPGGVGNSNGSNGQPLNLFWLDASALSLTNGDTVSSWIDKTNNNNDFVPSVNDPVNPIYNNTDYLFPIVRFSSTIGTGTKLIKSGAFSSFPDDNISILIVYKTATGTESSDGLVSYSVGTGSSSNAFFLYNSDNQTVYINGGSIVSGQSFNSGNFQIVTHKWRSSDGAIRIFRDGASVFSSSHASGASIASGGILALGGDQDDIDGGYSQVQAFDGDIAEVIMFDAYINDAERTIIENYLNVKYGILIANDVFVSGDPSYTYDLTGIGQELDGNYTSSVSGTTGFYVESTGSLDNGDYIMFAHNNSANSVSTTNITGAVQERWAKDWYIEQTNTQNARIIFDLPEGIEGDYPQDISNYVLLYRSGTSGNYAIATTSTALFADRDQVAFDILGANLSNGYYTLGTIDQLNSPVIGEPGTTWYTLVSGDWSDPAIWTLDPSGALPNNPSNSYPQYATDKVVIKTGKTVTMNLPGSTYSFASVTVNGRLDLQSKDHLYFNEIRGNGRIRMSAAVFPKYSNADHFIKAGQGEGTVVLYGNSFALDTIQEFYNLEIEMTAGQTVTLLEDYSINGYLRVKSGTLKINDDTPIGDANNINIIVKGDVEVLSGAFIATGTGNARHQFNFYGDLTNNGELRFTNRVSADYNNEAINGIVDANFLSASSNQNVTCNGISNFYRIEIDKGTDKTYILSIEASASANFSLFGYANEGHTSIAQLTENNNALGLLRGTVKIGNNINILRLNGHDNYNISEAAQLWVDGGSVTKNSGVAVVPYGTVKLSAGTFDALVSSGFTLRDNGLIMVEGGTMNTNQIRTSITGVQNVGGYVQTGGTVNVVNPSSTGDSYYHFSLTYPGNVFSMSGGTLHVYGANDSDSNSGGIFINSDPENVNISGGTVIAEITNAIPFKITSKSAFWNLILRNTSGNVISHTLDAGTNINNNSDADLAAQKLTVLNDFTIEADAILITNNENLEIGQNFNFESGATYTHGVNTTRFIGNKNGAIYAFDNSSPAPLDFYNVEIAKSRQTDPGLYYSVSLGNTGRTVAPTDANNVAIEITNNLFIIRGELNSYRYKISHLGDIEIVDGQILADGTNPGRIVLNGSSQQTFKGAYGKEQSFGHLDLNSTSGVILLSDINATEVTFSVDVLFDLDIYNLDLTGSINNYNNVRYFRTAGNSSDGGLTLHYTLSGTYAANSLVQTFPIGTSAGYTYGEIYVDNYTVATPLSGWMRVAPVNGYHPASTSNPASVLNYYWVSEQSGFESVPAVNAYYRFHYVSNVSNPFREHVLIDNVWVDANSGINGSPILEYKQATFGFVDGDFACGQNGQFNSRRVLYSRQSGDWHTSSTWSADAVLQHDGDAISNTPQPTDICVVGRGHRINATTAGFTIGMLEFEHDTTVSHGFEDIPRVQINGNYIFNFGKVIGTGMFTQWIGTSGNPTVTGDFGDFANEKYSWYLFVAENDNVVLPTTQYVFPNIATETNSNGWHLTFSQDIYINYNLNPRGNSILSLNNGTSGDIYVGGNCYIGDWEQGKIVFPSTGNNRTMTIMGDLDFTSYPGVGSLPSNYRELFVDNTTPSNLEHQLLLGGNIIQGAGVIDLYNFGVDSNNVVLQLVGDNDATFSRTGTELSELYRLILNKTQGKEFTFNNSFTLNGSTISNTKALELTSGYLTLNDPAINLDLTTGGSAFSIPATCRLEVLQGRINASGNSGINLDGSLIVSGGTVDMTGGDNYIQYSVSGNATIEVSDGSLNVGSQIRRGLGSDQGILIFNQSGGTVNVGVSAAGQNSRGVFEILNTGSSFTHTAGDFFIVNDYRSNPSTQSFYFDPETINLSSGTNITFGNALTQNGRGNFTMYVADSIMNLVIDNTSGFNPSVTMQVVPLTLKENLSILAGTELDANGLDVNILGNFNNSGTYTSNGNTTYFIGTGDQQINGLTTFYNLTKNTTNRLSLAASSEIIIDNVLSLEEGTFDDNDNNVNVKGNLFSNIVTSSAGNSDGIIMNGTAIQEITGSGTYAKLSINNVNGILVPTSNNITITEKLKLQSGVFDIGRNLLVLNENAIIEEASPFSENNMIQTNISFTDAGVKKYFPAINTPLPGPTTQFIYPMGSVGKYTPVQFDIETCEAGGAIRVKAADEMHISITEDSEAPDPEIVDADNVLQYNWTLDADGIIGFSATATMESYPDDVKVTPPYAVADYITARLLDAGLGAWTKYDVADFNEATNELYFYFAGTNDLGIDGDYTAGIDDAIPDMVPSYITRQDGPWNDANTWDTYPVSGGSVPAGGPRGAIVYVIDSVSMPVNFMAAYITNIESSGIINVGTTFGHRLGIVNGTGKLFLQRGDLPAGVYDGFFAADSGTIQFNGSTDYDILSEITYVNNMILTGTGERRFPNLDLTIYGELTIGDGVDNPVVINEHNQLISVYKDVRFNSGSFDAGIGDNAIFRMSGSTHQIIYGNFTGTNAFYHFQMNNPSGATLSSSDIEIDNNLILNSGVLYTNSTNTITLHSIQEDVVTGGGNSSHISGPLFKRINNGGSFYFPVGNSGRFGRVLVTNRNATEGYWQAQYYNQNPGSAGYDPSLFTDPLTLVSNGEYWRIQGPTGTDVAEVGLRWDSQSGMPTSDGTSRNQLKIAEWRDINNDSPGTTTDDIWQDIGLTYTIIGTSSSGTISSDVDINFDEFSTKGNIFTVSSIYVALDPTWDGSVSSVWNDPNNWTPAAVPTAADDIIIPSGMPNDPIISIHAVCGAMDLQSGAALTINPIASLTLSGGLTMNGNVSILSSASGTGSLLDNGTIAGTGTASVERYISGNKIYHYISPALSAVPQTTFSIAPWGAVNPNFYYYDETNNNPDWNYGWQVGSLISPNMDVARGYAFAFTYDNTFNMTGGNLNTGLINQPVTNSFNSVPSDGWNLIGNPYPSALSAEDFLSNATNAGLIDGTIYLWDDDGSEGVGYSSNDYATWNLAGAIGTSSGSGSKIPDGFLSNGQGFFVHATSSGNLSFNNSMRRIGNGQFFKNSPQDDAKRLRISLTNDAANLYNEAMLVFLQGATDGFDRMYDGRKNQGNPDIAFYSLLNNEEFAIQSFKPLSTRTNSFKEIPIGYKVTGAGSYSFNATHFENIAADLDVYLEDKKTKQTVNLKETSNYSFTTGAGTYNNRFVIRFNYNDEYTNSAPLLRRMINDYSATEDQTFSAEVDKNTFGDVDANDKLTYTAKLQGGSSLPTWLTFNPESFTFSGLPDNSDVGSLSVEITATDNSGAIATDVFNIEVVNVNDAPMVNSAIQDQNVNEKSTLAFTVPSNTFIDIDIDDQLTISLSMSDGSNWPAWLTYEPGSLTFKGTPQNDNVGTYSIKILATDNFGATVSDVFNIEVVNVNDAPQLVYEIPDQEVDQNALYDYTIPVNTFNEIDLNDELTLSVKMADGSDLPTWLNFDSATGKLSGTASDAGDLLLSVAATDIAGASVSDQFILSVKSTTGFGETSKDKIKIYPNPTKGQLVIETQKVVSNTRFIVRDYYGKTVTVKLAEGKSTSIDLSNFADGIYFIEMCNDFESSVFRIVLNK